jgi:PBP1b-binding outer membrane lipoprotein LpoB
MKVENFSNEELSPEEIKQLEELKRIIEAAVSDGKLSCYELEHIEHIALANKKLLSAELQLYSKLILDKIDRGELEYE